MPEKRQKTAKSGLSARQEKALAALLSSHTLEAAAAQAGCGDRTIRRWLQDDVQFQSAYREARRQIMDQAVVTLQRAYGTAVAELLRELTSDNESIRHRAAVAILDRADKWVATEALESRIAILEELYAELGKPTHLTGRGDN
jgi:recombinational DNA repair ATPase RecF